MEFTADILPLFLAVASAGVAGGIIAGLLGVGGGIVIVPVLFIVFGVIEVPLEVRMHLAVGTSLATIIITAISSARAHHKRGSLDMDLLRAWAPWIVFGVILGSLIGMVASGKALTGVFAVAALLVGLNMLIYPDGWKLRDDLPPKGMQAVIATFIGGISTLMGIGGGSFSVPTLTACNYPIRRAVGTASAIGLIIAVPGAIGFALTGLGAEGRPPLSIGYVNLAGFAVIVPMSALFAPLGAKLAHTLPPAMLKRAFALFLLATSVKMFLSLTEAAF